MHRIGDRWMPGSILERLHMLRNLCGEQPFTKVALVTSFWDHVLREEGEQREQELKTNPEFWGWMVEKGSRIARFEDRKSALSTVLSLANNTPLPLHIQHEMSVEGKPLIDTEAGIAVKRGESTSSTMLTRPGDRIRATIQSKISPKNGTYELRCKGSWQILEFCRHHLNGNHSLHHVITLTGTHQRAQATTCEDFVKTMWHSRGLALLDGIVSYLSGKSSSRIAN